MGWVGIQEGISSNATRHASRHAPVPPFTMQASCTTSERWQPVHGRIHMRHAPCTTGAHATHGTKLCHAYHAGIHPKEDHTLPSHPDNFLPIPFTHSLLPRKAFSSFAFVSRTIVSSSPRS